MHWYEVESCAAAVATAKQSKSYDILVDSKVTISLELPNCDSLPMKLDLIRGDAYIRACN